MKNKAYLLPACKTADGVPIGIGSEVYAITFKQKVNKYGRLYRPSTRELAVVKVTVSTVTRLARYGQLWRKLSRALRKSLPSFATSLMSPFGTAEIALRRQRQTSVWTQSRYSTFRPLTLEILSMF